MRKTQLLIATRNPKKRDEMAALLKGLPIQVLTLADFKNVTEIEEDGKTFRENAEKKALGYAKQTGCLTLAEDSGLCVDYLKGEPGVYSARFSGSEKNDLKNCEKVLKLLKGVPEEKRTASFKCTAALALPGKILEVVEEEVEGRIAYRMHGTGGFGYDPLFFYPGFGKTFGEVSPEMKHRVSHRGKALRKIRGRLAQP